MKGITKNRAIIIAFISAIFIPVTANAAENSSDYPLNRIDPSQAEGSYYVPSDIENIQWGNLPNLDSSPVLTIPSGETVTFDTVSHEGILEDQGRDPVEYFSQYGVKEDEILDEAKQIASSNIEHDFEDHGPHVVTGPVAIEGAESGDVLKVEVLSLEPRVPYGVISNRHYKGALPGEFPENEGPEEGANAENPERYNNISTFTPIKKTNGKWYGEILGEDVSFPIEPFMGIMGVASNTHDYVHSVPPSKTGGNLDINELGVGSTLYLPVEVDGGLFYTGDPHFSQGDGEVALTALEGSLRGTFRLTVLKSGESNIPGDNVNFTHPFGETSEYWIPIGLHEDLDEAMKQATRESIDFLSEELGMERANALAYLSATTDYEVSQVVDKTKGIHGLIRKSDFTQANKNNIGSEDNGDVLPKTATDTPLFIFLGLSIILIGTLLLLINQRIKTAK